MMLSGSPAGLASISVAYLRSSWEENVEHSAVGAVAMAAERGAHAVAKKLGRVARGSRCAANERLLRSKRAEPSSVEWSAVRS